MNDKRDRQRANRDTARLAAAEADAASRRKRSMILVGVVAVVGVLIIALLAARGGDDEPETVTEPAVADTSDTTDSTETTPTESASGVPEGCPAEDGSSPRTIVFAGPQPMCIDPTQTHVAVFDTSMGEIRVTLDAASVPITVNNFVTLARWGYYDGTTIHRTAPSIDIIQGGSPTTESAADPGPGYTIPDEPQFDQTANGMVGPYRYVPGQLVMARTPAPDSASAQYFFTTGPNAALLDSQGVYVVFGETDEAGLAVTQDIIGLHVEQGALGGAPSETVTVNSVTIEVS